VGYRRELPVVQERFWLSSLTLSAAERQPITPAATRSHPVQRKEVTMKSIRCWEDCPFRHCAIDGRSLRLSYRILCDVTTTGKKIIEKALDVANLKLREKLESRQPDDPHVGCVMLAPELLPFPRGFCPVGTRLLRGLADKDPASRRIETDDVPGRTDALHRYCGENCKTLCVCRNRRRPQPAMMSGRVH